MRSTRNDGSKLARRLITLGLAVMAGVVVGCQRIVPPTAAKVNDKPVAGDLAMQKRDWDRSVCYYGNGDTVAGGTGYMYQVHETIPPKWRRVTDVPVAVTNIVLLPVGVFVNSPFKPQVYQGEIIPPTYTAQPPLP